MDTLAATAVQMLGSSQNQQIGIAVAKQQLAADKAVAGLVADSAQSAEAPVPRRPPDRD